MSDQHYILTLSCKDARGIVAAVTGFLSDNYGFIIESAQFGDASTGQFFLRMEFTLEEGAPDIDAFRELFYEQLAQSFGMSWQLVDKAQKSRVLLMVSKEGHCLNDVLHRYVAGQLSIEIPAIVSNHDKWQKVADWHEIPFCHLPVTNENKAQSEEQLWKIIQEQEIDVVLLARYMQILSPDLCSKLSGMAINIHHSFLPSFKGAQPYKQAHDRGVKLIGATAHYITNDLDEGPIIEQEVSRVDHTDGVEELTAIGRDIESLVLARALKNHTEHRVLINGNKTVVFK